MSDTDQTEEYRRGYLAGYYDGMNKVLDSLDKTMFREFENLRKNKIIPKQGGQK